MMRVPPNSTVDSTPDPPSDASRSAWPAKGCDLDSSDTRARLARDVLHDRHGAFADQCDRDRVGAHAVAHDAAGGVGGAEKRGPARRMSPCLEIDAFSE
jgi:hypothetical protein